MYWIRFTALLLVAALLQAAGFLDVIAVTRLSVKPDLLLILLVFAAVYYNTTEVMITSFTIGFAADIISVGSPMGPQIIGFGLFGTALAYLHRVIAIRRMPHQSVVIFIVCMLAGALAQLLALLVGKAAANGAWRFLFGTATYSAVVGPFLFLPMAWWMRISGVGGRGPGGGDRRCSTSG